MRLNSSFLQLSRCLFNSKNKLVCQERPENLGVYCEHMRSQSAFLILQFTSNISKIILPSILKMVKNQFAL